MTEPRDDGTPARDEGENKHAVEAPASPGATTRDAPLNRAGRPPESSESRGSASTASGAIDTGAAAAPRPGEERPPVDGPPPAPLAPRVGPPPVPPGPAPAPASPDDEDAATAGDVTVPEAVVAEAMVPPPPRSLERTGLSPGFLGDLALKHVYFGGDLEGIEVADRMALAFPLVEELLHQLKRQELIVAQGGSGVLRGVRMRHQVTERGRKRVEEILRRDNYCGPAPVPYDQYVGQIHLQTIRQVQVSPQRVTQAFDRLVLDPAVPRRIGPAIHSGRSIFLYGPPGNGKTSLAECLVETIGGQVFIPRAVRVDSEIVRVFDELYHEPVHGEVRYDPRWVLSRRPRVMVGGELSLETLDLTTTGQATYYEAPFQMKANSGVLFIDDFGRQRCDPQELLNRWIVPLESGFDFLTFRSGQKVRVPFDNLLVFATNLDPKELVDEAFLRRIRYKIEIGDPSPAQYKQIWERTCERHGLPYDGSLVDHLIQQHYVRPGRPLRSCHPRDLLEQVVDIGRYRGQRPALTRALLDELCDLYFVEL
jgi:hypothetical protein